MTFWMDIHGELGPEERREWEKHLAGCDACRKEKALASQMMGQIKQALTPQPLSHAALTAMVDRIVEKSQKRAVPFPYPNRRWFIPGAVFPAFAAACLLLAVGVFSLKSYFPDSGQPNAPVANLNEALETEDLEIIENMELLTEFETLEQLVHMVEEQNSPPKTDEQIQGQIDGGGKLVYG